MLLRLRLSPHALKEFTDNADATDFIFSRISFCVATWYWIYYGLYLHLYGAGLPPARVNPWKSQRPAGAEKSNNTIKIRERTNPSHPLSIRDRFWTWRASQRRVSSSTRYCLPDSYFCVVVKTPRLRPGLLSLRSVLASRQILWLLVVFE